MRILLTIVLLYGVLLGSAQAELTGKFFFNEEGIKETGLKSIEGTTVSPSARGIVIRQPSGRLSKRHAWTLFTQESLRQFHADPQIRPLVEVLIDIKEEDIKAGNFVPDIPERAPRPPVNVSNEVSPGVPPTTGLIAGFFSGGGMILMLLMAGASGWAGWVMGDFKRYPKPVFAGIGAAVPFLGPIVMYFLPPRRMRINIPTDDDEEEEEEEEEDEEEEEEEEYVEPEPEVPAAPTYPETQVFKRGDFNLNRRFVEHRFAKFTKPLPAGEEEMIMVVKSARGEFITNHILKMPDEGMTIQIQKSEGATVDETIPYTDLLEIKVKHRDAPE